MFAFYKVNIQYLTEHAVDPDARRYVVAGEAPRHYIDLDVYGDSALEVMPRRWADAVAKYSEDTLLAYGIVPWHIQVVRHRLTRAFQDGDARRILKLSAELGHYVGDANVPLHTTVNYNGQFSGQYGIHGFWETRLTERFSDEYDLFTGQAEYLEDPLNATWDAVGQAHRALDSVFRFERILTEKMGDDKKFGFETRAGKTIKVYSDDFATAYHTMLNGQVERQMRASIRLIGNFWLTCWIDAGQPDLRRLLPDSFTDEELEQLEKDREAQYKEPVLLVRPHEDF